MLTISRAEGRHSQKLPRRDFLQIGLLGLLVLALPRWGMCLAAGNDWAGDGLGRAQRCITVFLSGAPSQRDLWDLGRIYWHMLNRLVPPTDQAARAELSEQAYSLLGSSPLVQATDMGEIGQTPRLNTQAGRDHWPKVQSILLAAAGITGASVHGASDRAGVYPVADPVTPDDLGQTILHLLGVPEDFELRDRQGRPVPASRGKVLAKWIS